MLCRDCKRHFSRRTDFERHWRGRIPCPSAGCTQSFRTDKASALRSHVEKKHGRDTASIVDIDAYFKRMRREQRRNIIPHSCVNQFRTREYLELVDRSQISPFNGDNPVNDDLAIAMTTTRGEPQIIDNSSDEGASLLETPWGTNDTVNGSSSSPLTPVLRAVNDPFPSSHAPTDMAPRTSNIAMSAESPPTAAPIAPDFDNVWSQASENAYTVTQYQIHQLRDIVSSAQLVIDSLIYQGNSASVSDSLVDANGEKSNYSFSGVFDF